MNAEVKPGIWSTEFWMSIAKIIPSLVGFFVSLGIVATAEQEAVVKMITGIIGSLGSLLIGSVVAWNYVRERTSLKRELLRTEVQTVMAERSRPAEVTMEIKQEAGK